jgi:hypothetical protein
MTSIDIINNFLGEQLTPGIADRLSNGPEDQVIELIQEIAPCYYDWLENEEANPTNGDQQNCFCIDPFERNLDWQKQIDIYKKHLLYFPKFTIPDPLASFLCAPINVAQLFGTIAYDDKFKQSFKEAITLLAELAPLIRSNDIQLMPLTFATDYNSVQESTRKELDFILTHEQGSYYNSLFSLEENQSSSKEAIEQAVARGDLEK